MSTGLFLGRDRDSAADLRLKPDRLRTHGVVVGMTGSGKTGLSLVLLEELIRAGVPILAIDPKGDLGNLGLVFPELAPGGFEPWVGDASAVEVAGRWKDGIAKWQLGPGDVTSLRERMELTVYTPGSEAGVPVNLLGAFTRPAPEVLAEGEARRELVAGTVSGLLGLVGKAVDPVKDPAHIVLSQILEQAWMAGEDPTLETLILRLVDPPFEKVGVFPLDRFFTPDKRMDLAMTFNGVVASPAFAPWTTGATLDLDRMLARGPKTQVHIFSLAHLADTERQFFLSVLLGQLKGWSRNQPGTEDLRAVLFFDEVMGYLPPYPANPPTKAPLLTLMKQARAVGLGVVLATQNPVDLDYKALSNAGLWCIGRLSTKQDRERLLTGIEGAGLDAAVASLEKRQFLIHQVGSSQPQVVQSRHAMCYLRGPFTRVEIAKLNALHGGALRPVAAPTPTGSAPRAAAPAPTDGLLPVPPSVPGHDAWFLDSRTAFSARVGDLFSEAAGPRRGDGLTEWAPALVAELNLRFDEEKAGFVLDQHEWRVWYPLEAHMPTAHHSLKFDEDDLSAAPPEGALFHPLPSWADEASELSRLQKEVLDDVYRAETRGLFTNKALKLYGKTDEDEAGFKARCVAAVEARIDEKVSKLKDKYEDKAERIEEKIRQAEAKVVELEGVARSRKLEEAVSFGETIFALFSGRKRSLSSAVSKRQKTSRAGDKVEQEEDKLSRLREQVQELESELAEEVEAIRDEELKALESTEAQEVRLEKTDIRMERFGVLWVPVTRRV